MHVGVSSFLFRSAKFNTTMKWIFNSEGLIYGEVEVGVARAGAAAASHLEEMNFMHKLNSPFISFTRIPALLTMGHTVWNDRQCI